MLYRLAQKLMDKLPEGTLRHFPGFSMFESLYKHKELTIHPNKLTFYSFVPKFLVSEDYNSAEHLSVELNPTKVRLPVFKISITESFPSYTLLP